MEITKQRLPFLFATVVFFQCVAALWPTHAHAQRIITSHAIAMHGDIKYPAGFSHFEYTKPNAPKGGRLKLGAFGSFDSLNPFIPKGSAADGIDYLYDSLTTGSSDEAFTQYGLVASHLEYPEDRSWITFHIDPRAQFHDGTPITADDVVFTFNLLMEKGAPYYAMNYAQVKHVKALTKRSVKFTFNDASNKELALIVGQLPILPKHFWKDKDFSKSSTVVPLGSGPYTIKQHTMGRNIEYTRVTNYWGKSRPVNRGKYNFESLQYDYYQDSVALLEGLKSGEFDFRYENSSKQWATGYQGKSLDKGWLKKEHITHNNPTGMQAFVMNLRSPLFSDIRVRKALNLAFDFEWTNNQLFYKAYDRTNSYFSNSELASRALPSPAELKLLSPFKTSLPPSVFTSPYQSPVSSADGYNRKHLLRAKALLESAGWKVTRNVLTDTRTGAEFRFEIMLVSPAFERIVNPYVQALKKLGIIVTVRHVEVAQYVNRLRHFKYDMVVGNVGQSLSPGNEQKNYWHSSSADIPSSNNLAGIKHPAVDQLVEHVIQAKTRPALITASRALDRVLLHQHYMIPQWHSRKHRIAYWNKFSKPKISPKYDSAYRTGLMTWWYDPSKANSLKRAMGQ